MREPISRNYTFMLSDIAWSGGILLWLGYLCHSWASTGLILLRSDIYSGELTSNWTDLVYSLSASPQHYLVVLITALVDTMHGACIMLPKHYLVTHPRIHVYYTQQTRISIK